MNNCPNCGSKVNQGEVFCSVCGAKLPLPQNNFSNGTQQSTYIDNQNNFSNDTQQSTYVGNQNTNYQQAQNNTFNSAEQPSFMNNNMIDDEALVDAYIGKNADKLKNGGFSVNTFFFGFIYVLYRKMWLLGFIWLAISMIANMFLSYFAGLITLGTNIFISIQFKKYYLKHVREEVAKIKENNPGKSNVELINICSQKGGTSILVVILILVFYSIMLFVAISMAYNKVGYLFKHSTNIDDLEITIPSNMSLSYSNSRESYKYISYSDKNHNCKLILTAHSSIYDDNASEYLKSQMHYSDGDTFSGIEEKEINNNIWNYASVIKKYNTEYHYVIIHNNLVYEVTYDIENNISTDDPCISGHNTVLNSLRFK